MSQSRLSSFIEAMANTLIGYVINIGVQLIIYPIYGAVFSFRQNIEIGLVFMVVSIARSYVLRRWFNLRIHNAIMSMSGETK